MKENQTMMVVSLLGITLLRGPMYAQQYHRGAKRFIKSGRKREREEQRKKAMTALKMILDDEIANLKRNRHKNLKRELNAKMYVHEMPKQAFRMTSHTAKTQNIF